MLASVRGIDLQLAHCPLFDGADACARRERAVDGFVLEVDRNLDLLAPGDVDSRAGLETFERVLMAGLERPVSSTKTLQSLSMSMPAAFMARSTASTVGGAGTSTSVMPGLSWTWTNKVSLLIAFSLSMALNFRP